MDGCDGRTHDAHAFFDLFLGLLFALWCRDGHAGGSAEQAARVAGLRAEAYRKEHPAPPPNREDLGVQRIAGVSAEGKRHTMVIPTGQMGNDREITVTETWTSPERKIVVSRTTDDPRMGKTTMVVSDLQRAEPDAALFQIPSEYRVIESPAPMMR
jgi:hypothetical protein